MTFLGKILNTGTQENTDEHRIQNLCSIYFPFKSPEIYNHISLSIILFKKKLQKEEKSKCLRFSPQILQ